MKVIDVDGATLFGFRAPLVVGTEILEVEEEVEV
jgi:hypothetical protein